MIEITQNTFTVEVVEENSSVEINKIENTVEIDTSRLVVSVATSASFLQMSDTPNSYTGQADKLVAVNDTENGLEFVDPPVQDHGGLTGLSDDDHTQYHNDARGDARYFTQAQSTANFEPKNVNIQSHISSNSNPHNVTATQVGLGSVDNTSDLNKPISSATQSALDLKSNIGHTHPLSDIQQSSATTGQIPQWNGTNWVPVAPPSGVTDHTLLSNIGTNSHTQIDSHISSTSNPHSVTKTQIGLSNVENVDTTTTANITDSSNKRFVTDAQQTVLNNTSGTNTGDQDLSGLTPNTRSISTTAPLGGGGNLTSDRTLSITQSTTSTDGYLSSTDWNTFNGKQAALGFTPENLSNKATDFSTVNDTLYPSVEAVEERVQAIPNFIGEDGTNVGVKGLVPAPSVLDGQTKSKFLMADGTWSGQTEYHTARAESLVAIGAWTQASTSLLPFGIVYAEDKQLYVAINSSSSANFQTSRDGKTWRNAAVPFANTWTKGAYSPELGRFVAVSFAGANRSVYSDDGINWTLSGISNAQTWYDVCWSPQLRLFCAVSLTGGTGCATSPDGITWTNRTFASGSSTNFYSVCWSPELSLFCTVRLNGAAYTSPDGINWTSRPSIGNKSWSRVIWAKELGLFVAVGVSGTNRASTSPDGITWTARNLSGSAWRSVAWSAELGMLLAVASGGQIAYSFDGISWTNGTNPQATNQWYDVHWNRHLGQFVIAGITGTAKLMRSRYTRSFAPANHMEYIRPVAKSVGTAFTLNENQKYATIVKTTGGAQTITIPENATYPAPIGFEGKFVQAGTDAITFVPASGAVTIISRGGLLSTNGQGSVVNIQKIDVNEWVLSGDLA